MYTRAQRSPADKLIYIYTPSGPNQWLPTDGNNNNRPPVKYTYIYVVYIILLSYHHNIRYKFIIIIIISSSDKITGILLTDTVAAWEGDAER